MRFFLPENFLDFYIVFKVWVVFKVDIISCPCQFFQLFKTNFIFPTSHCWNTRSTTAGHNHTFVELPLGLTTLIWGTLFHGMVKPN